MEERNKKEKMRRENDGIGERTKKIEEKKGKEHNKKENMIGEKK